jgi:hypothetical protein
MGKLFADNLRRMERVLRRFEIPLVAHLGATGGLRVVLAAGDWLLPPKDIT